MIDSQTAIFRDPDQARAALEAIRWPNGPVCPHCGSAERIGSGRGKSHRAGLYRCGSCARQFTATVHTLFEGSKIPLNKWWLAIHLLGSFEEEVSINELHRTLGVTYKTAWLMAQRLRRAVKGRQLSSIGESSEEVGSRKSGSAKSPKTGSSKKSGVPTRTATIMSALIAQGKNASSKNGFGEATGGRDAESKKRDPQSTRTAILEVACNLLAKDGHEGLSLTEVAQIAGVNRGTAYHHFKTREKLVKATTDWVSEQLYWAMYGDPAKREERPVEKWDVPELNDRLASFALKNPELCRVWLLQILASPDPGNDLFWREYQLSAARWAKSKFAQPGVDHEVTTVLTLASHFLWPVWVQAHFKGKRDDQKLARRFTDELLRLSVFGSLRAEYYPDIIKRLEAAGKAPHQPKPEPDAESSSGG
jgi:AcrR family transcriptional regulator/transposase-like protein